MNKSRIVAVSAVLAALLSATANANPQNPDQQAPTGLALEIVFLKGQRPSLLPVAGARAKQSGVWTPRFGKVEGWQLPDGALPIKAVQVQSRLEGELVKIWVAVLSGRETFEREEPVITYELREGDKIEVAELTRFGVEPIEIKVVRVQPHVAFLPRVINKTNSIIVTDIAPKTSTLPAYKLSLQNLSNKSVAALAVEVVAGGKMALSMMPQGAEGQPLIAAEGRYELSVSGSYQTRPAVGDNPPDLPRDHDCVIRAAVFNDGSYEGDPEPASQFRAFVKGRKIQIRRVVALLQEALNSRDATAATLQRLRAGLVAIKIDVDGSEAEELINEFPNLSVSAKAALTSAIQASLGDIKMAVGEEFDKFEKTQAAAPSMPDLRLWLLASKEKYERWLSNL